ncbi:MAG: helix-turn-helix domain-containing protein [Spirochaetia bacterium]
MEYKILVKKYIRLLVIISALLVLILGVSLTYIFERSMQDQVFVRSLEVLKKNSQFPSFYKDISKTAIRQIYLSRSFQEVQELHEIPIKKRVDILSYLRQIASAMPFLDTIYYYHEKSDQIFVTLKENQTIIQHRKFFYDKSFINIISGYRNFDNFVPILRKKNSITQADPEVFVYTYLMYNRFPVDELKFIIALNFSQEQFSEFLASQNTGLNTIQYAIDRYGEVKIGNGFYRPLEDLSSKEYIRTIIDSREPAGHFVQQIPGEGKKLFTFFRSADTGWIFISEHPYRSIIRVIHNLRIVFTVIILSAILLLFFFYSPLNKRVLNTTDSLLTEMGVLEKERREFQRVARRKILRDIVHGYTTIDTETYHEIIDDMPDKGYTKKYQFLLTKQVSETEEYPLVDMHSLAANLTPRLTGQASIIEYIRYGAGTVLFLLSLDNKPDDLRKSIKEDIREDYLFENYSFGLTGTAEEFFEINSLSYDIHTLSHRQFFSSPGDFFYAPNIIKKNDFKYPEDAERSLLDALLRCEIETCKDIIRKIILATQNYDQIAFQMTVYRIIYGLKKAVNAVNIEDSSIEGFEILMQQMSKETDAYAFPTVFLLLRRITAVVDSICELITAHREGRKHKIICKVDKLIRQYYSDTNFHLGQIAELVDLNPAYLSRIYKQATGESVPKKIMAVRIEKVKDELKTTKKTIKQILKESGISENPYFFKVFKEYTGMTPRQFRNTARK